jgi:hypothetical protein
MADLKISALTGASTPRAGTEVLPIVQSGSTVKVSVANLTAGRAVATAGGSFTDNITQSTAAKGVNFTANTPAAGMTSQLLNWYEEGTWTPAFQAGTSGSITSTDRGGRYTRIGRLVTVEGYINIASVLSPTGDLRISGLPFNIQNSSPGAGAVFVYGFANLPAATAVQLFAAGGQDYAVIRGFLNGTQVSGYAANAQGGAGAQFSLTYSV